MYYTINEKKKKTNTVDACKTVRKKKVKNVVYILDTMIQGRETSISPCCFKFKFSLMLLYVHRDHKDY